MNIEELNEELDDELDDVYVEDDEDGVEDPGGADEDFDIDDELEYDEEGNIVIPDGDEADEGDPEEDDASDAPQGEDEDDSDEGSDEDSGVAEPADKGESAEILRLKRELETLRSQGRDTLKALGVENPDDVLGGLVKLAAETEEQSPEEYLKKREETRRNEEALRTARRIAFEQKKANDLAAVHASYPETRKYDSVEKFPNFKRFAELRDLGATPEEAYNASHPAQVRENASSAARQQSLNDTKKHLKSTVPKGSKGESVSMTRKELAEWRELFPDKSDKEILGLYRRTATKKAKT